MKIIALVAPKAGGKDTVASILQELKKSNTKISFAGPLKDICSKVFDIPLVMFNDPVFKEKPLKQPVKLTAKHLREIKNECVRRVDPQEGDKYLYNPNKATIIGLEGRIINTPRELMQIIGTDFIRNRIYGEFHLRAAFDQIVLNKLKDRYGTNAVYCVTDLRFLNEYEYLKNKFKDDFICYYVERPEAEENLAKATHVSELEVLKIKALLGNSIIKNDGSLEDLTDKLKNLDLPQPKKVEKGSRLKYVEKK